MSDKQNAVVQTPVKSGIFGFLRQVPLNDPKLSFCGKNVIVTGSNTGLGFEAAIKFAALDASRIILAVRDIEKGEAAKSKIAERTGREDRIEVWQLDMDSYESIREFASRASTLDHLDVVVLNAGVYMVDYRISKYGWEETLQVNLLSTVLLGLLLIPKLRSSRTSVSVPTLEFVSSGNYERASLNEEQRKADNILQLFNKKETYGASVQYSTSKLFLMYAMQTIATLAASSDPSREIDFIVTSVCPGYCQSDLSRGYTGYLNNVIRALLNTFFLRHTEEGARTLVSGTTLSKEAHGGFWQNDILKPLSPLLVGEDGEKLRQKIWEEIVDALKKDIPEIDDLIEQGRQAS